MRNKNGHLGNIWVERDMKNDRGYDEETWSSSSLIRCGGEGGQRYEGVEGVEETRERRGGSVKVTPWALISNMGSAH